MHLRPYFKGFHATVAGSPAAGDGEDRTAGRARQTESAGSRTAWLSRPLRIARGLRHELIATDIAYKRFDMDAS